MKATHKLLALTLCLSFISLALSSTAKQANKLRRTDTVPKAFLKKYPRLRKQENAKAGIVVKKDSTSKATKDKTKPSNNTIGPAFHIIPEDALAFARVTLELDPPEPGDIIPSILRTIYATRSVIINKTKTIKFAEARRYFRSVNSVYSTFFYQKSLSSIAQGVNSISPNTTKLDEYYRMRIHTPSSVDTKQNELVDLPIDEDIKFTILKLRSRRSYWNTASISLSVKPELIQRGPDDKAILKLKFNEEVEDQGRARGRFIIYFRK